MKNKIDQILNSINNIKIVKTKPYFYTRLSTKIESLNYKEKKSIEKRFRRLDLTVMNDLSENVDTNNINKDKYYKVAVELNKAKMYHWVNIREISNKEQSQKLDSIWLNLKKRIESRSQ